MATAGDVLTIVQEIEAISNEILAGISAVDPALGLPTANIASLEDLANKTAAAFIAASGPAITVASVTAEAPNPTPLTAPTS